MNSRIRQEPILTPTYRLNQFGYTFKLNQRVKAASIKKNNYVKFCKIEELENDFQKLLQLKVTEPVEVIKFINRECYCPIVAIRRWKIWVNTHKGYNPLKCYPCDLKKSSLAQAKLLPQTFWTKELNKYQIYEKSYKSKDF
jgi:hypothetical protein